MSGTFTGIYTSLRGIQAQQKALQTTAHNVANANTPGFTRQRAVMSTSPALPVPSMNNPGGAGQYGTGVQIDEIARIRDEFLDTQLRKETGSLARWEERSGSLERVEVLFMEPLDSGLSSILNQFWSGWQELSKNAENPPIRTTVKETAQALAEALRHIYEGMESIRTDLNRKLELNISEINGDSEGNIASRIVDLNEKIAAIKLSGFQPNDLMDQRDLLLDELARYTNFNTVKNYDGTVNIEMGSSGIRDYTNLVEGQLYALNITLSDTNTKLNVGFFGGADNAETAENIRQAVENAAGEDYNVVFNDPEIIVEKNGTPVASLDLSDFGSNQPREALVVGRLFTRWKVYDNGEVVWANDAPVDQIQNGEIQGILEVRAQVEGYMDELDLFARSLINRVNDLHVSGFDLNGDPGGIFFSGSGAASIAVAIDDVAKIAASADAAAGPGDGANALEIAQLRDRLLEKAAGPPEELVFPTPPGEGEVSFDDYYKNLISQLGVESHEARRMVDNQEALVGQLSEKRDATAGVSLDEEMAYMIQYQHAYNASARIISIMDEMLDTIINRMF